MGVMIEASFELIEQVDTLMYQAGELSATSSDEILELELEVVQQQCRFLVGTQFLKCTNTA